MQFYRGFCEAIKQISFKFEPINLDMAAKRRKKHKNKISGRVNSMCYYEQKIEIMTFYESIKLEP